MHWSSAVGISSFAVYIDTVFFGYTTSTFGGTAACTSSCETTTIPEYDDSLYSVTSPPPDVNGNVPWSYGDSPSGQAYPTLTTAGQYGKPGLQAYFQQTGANNGGSVNVDSSNSYGLNGWTVFLNYYFWTLLSKTGLIPA